MAESSDLPHRLVVVFPPGFDSKLKSSSSCGHQSLTPKNLYHELTYDYKPYIESTHVTAIWYGKQKKRARHEFIMLEVEHPEAGLKNFVVLDRNNADRLTPKDSQNPNSHRGIFGCGRSCQSPALDAFRVSYDGNLEQLLQECQLISCRYLERIDFTGSEHLFLYQLVTLVNIVSELSPNYAVTGKNCYWFAGIIWECIRALRPEARYDGRRASLKGCFAGLRYTPNRAEIERICTTYDNDIKSVDERLAGLRKAWARNDRSEPKDSSQ